MLSPKIDYTIPQELRHPSWYNLSWGRSYGLRMTNVLCSDGKRRTAMFTADPDTMFTQPAVVKVNGKSVSGHVYYDSMAGDFTGIWKFTAYSYRKNGNLLPSWSKE